MKDTLIMGLKYFGYGLPWIMALILLCVLIALAPKWVLGAFLLIVGIMFTLAIGMLIHDNKG